VHIGNREHRHWRGVLHTLLAGALAAMTALALVWSWPTPVLALAVTAIASTTIVIWLGRSSVAVVAVASVVGGIGAQLPRLSGSALAHGMVVGLVVALSLAGPLAVAGLLRQLRAYHRRGWALADAEARQHAAAVNNAVQSERMAIAAEMHDGLGHALTLIAVRLGRLSLAGDLPDAVRAEISAVRQAAAQAAGELGTAVRLLQDPQPVTPHGGLASTIANARDAGMTIEDHTPDGLEELLSTEAAAAVVRVVQEGLTNAAKHAPGSWVAVDADVSETEVRVTVRNARSRVMAASRGRSSGVGLVGLRQRVGVLGGSLSTAFSDDEYVLCVVIPRHAKPIGRPPAGKVREVAAEESIAVKERTRAARTAAVAPAALVTGIAFVATAYFAMSNVFSVIAPSEFDDIAVGDTREDAQQKLPPLEMLDAPRDENPVAPGEECRYYETAISFFARVDVVYVCFDESSVTRTGTVKPDD
jgi:signal transduction histidine kinase